MDSLLQAVAFDHGAALILGGQSQSGLVNNHQVSIPPEVLSAIRENSGALSSVKARFRKGDKEYVCRLYLMEPQNLGVGQRFLALHFERESSAHDAVHELSIAFRLTDREEQVLRGIALGLSGKQLAERMKISPNTVKVYLRLIMAKMGVTGRGEIAAKLLSWESDSRREKGYNEFGVIG